MADSKKKLTKAVAVATAAALLLGGTFAWQSISQKALNEASDVINPGGRLHDDFYIDADGNYNSDIYVENFADDEIFARVRLEEYFEIVTNKGLVGADGTLLETVHTVAGSKTLKEGAVADPVNNPTGKNLYDYTYETHYFDQDNTTDEYWTLTPGDVDSETVYYMPTFNKNKDSLVPDRNGMYVDRVGGISDRGEGQYEDYEVFTDGQEAVETAIYDADSNMDDEVKENFDDLSQYEADGNIVTTEETHTAQAVGTSNGLISMSEWQELLANGDDTSNYWVYDEDGWVYWTSPITKDSATGLLLDSISLNKVMDDSWYYALNVIGQFVTADDLGMGEGTGFYKEPDAIPSDDALTLLEAIGVDVTGEGGGDEPGDDDPIDTESSNITFDYDTEIPMAVPAGANIQLGLDNYENPENIKYYLVNQASNADVDDHSVTLPEKDGLKVISRDISIGGNTYTEYYYGEEVSETWVASFSDDTTSNAVECVMIVAVDEDTTVAEAVTKVYDNTKHNYIGSNSEADNYVWLLVFEALDENGKAVGHCVANAAQSIATTDAMEKAIVEVSENKHACNVIEATETPCDGDHSTAIDASVLKLYYEDTELTSVQPGGEYSLSVKDDAEKVVSSWNIVGNRSSATTIDSDGNLTVGYFEDAPTIDILATVEGEYYANSFTVSLTGSHGLTDVSDDYGLARANGSDEDPMIYDDGQYWPGSIINELYVVEKALFTTGETTIQQMKDANMNLTNLKSMEVVGNDISVVTAKGSLEFGDGDVVTFGIVDNEMVGFRTNDEAYDENALNLYIITNDGKYILHTFEITNDMGE